jgi:phospholipid-binding lipoprotein MlaA
MPATTPQSMTRLHDAFLFIRLPRLLIASVCLTALLAGCATPIPRQDDPYEKFNRAMYALNDDIDSVLFRPLAVGYRAVTPKPVRTVVDNFFSNIHLPISIVNFVLQGRPQYASAMFVRLVINSTIGLAGLFDPATALGLKEDTTDLGITLARWGVPEGPYLFLPIFGPSGPRDALGLAGDLYSLDALTWFERKNSYDYHAEYAPEALFVISKRESYIDQEKFVDEAYDPYIFVRDAYRQMRVDKIYHGNPPPEVVQSMQGISDTDAEKLLEEQKQFEKEKGQEPPPAKPAD